MSIVSYVASFWGHQRRVVHSRDGSGVFTPCTGSHHPVLGNCSLHWVPTWVTVIRQLELSGMWAPCLGCSYVCEMSCNSNPLLVPGLGGVDLHVEEGLVGWLGGWSDSSQACDRSTHPAQQLVRQLFG